MGGHPKLDRVRWTLCVCCVVATVAVKHLHIPASLAYETHTHTHTTEEVRKESRKWLPSLALNSMVAGGDRGRCSRNDKERDGGGGGELMRWCVLI